MREILFRGKRIDTGEWVDGFYAKSGDKTFILVDNDIAVGYVTMKEVIPETVGQFTGLTDRNGKRIFEGDIVKREYTLCHGEKKRTREIQIGIVVYSDDDCGYWVDKKYSLRKPWDGDTVEVIGNINDNPELMKGGEGDG